LNEEQTRVQHGSGIKSKRQ